MPATTVTAAATTAAMATVTVVVTASAMTSTTAATTGTLAASMALDKKNNKDTDSDKDDLDNNNSNNNNEDEDKDQWDVVCVITPNEEKVECGTDKCSDPAVVTWSPISDPDFKFDLCKNCQDEHMGGYDNDRVVPNTNSTTTNNKDLEDLVDDSDSEGEQEDGDHGGDSDSDGGTKQYLYTSYWYAFHKRRG